MKNMKLKTILTLAALALLLTCTVSGTLAYLSTGTETVENVFTPVTVGVDVTDEVKESVKSNVVIKNTSDIPVYIRAAIVGYWVDEVGNVVAPLKESDGKFEGLPGTGWTKIGDYYYYTSPVAAGAELKNSNALFTSYTVPAEKPAGADHLVMDILTQAVQAEPKDAVTELWEVTVNADKTLSVSN